MDRNFGWPKAIRGDVRGSERKDQALQRTRHVPNFESNVSFPNPAKVERDCRHNVLTPLLDVNKLGRSGRFTTLTWPDVITLTNDVFPEAL